MSASGQLSKIKLVSPAVLPETLKFRQVDFAGIFHGKKILFIGDSAMRILFRDFFKMGISGQRLSDGECRALRPDCTVVEGETQVKCEGTAQNEFDIRSFAVKSMNLVLSYVYLCTLSSSDINSSLEWIKANSTYDMVVFSAGVSDISFVKIRSSTLSFPQQLAAYEENLGDVCRFLTRVCRTESMAKCLFVWLSPLPKKVMSDLEKTQFNEIVTACENVAKNHNFYQFPELQRWPYKSASLLGKLGWNLSSQGARSFNELLSELCAAHWKRPLRALESPASSSEPSPSQQASKRFKSQSSLGFNGSSCR